MEVKIFFSWQLTTPKKYNMNFIEEVIEASIRQVEKDLKTELKEIIIDRDTQFKSGLTNIVQSIEEKITGADIFIGDLTIINGPKPKERLIGLREKIWNKVIGKVEPEPPKFIPSMNNNVLLELGEARGKIGNERIINIMNHYYGSPHEDDSIIPFDIKQSRWPIGYNLSDNNITERPQIKAKLKSELASAIKDILITELSRRKTKYQPFLVFKEWERALAERLKIEYFTTEQIDSLKETIKTNAQKVQTFTRIVGLSGLGKTRLVFEALSENEPNENISRLVLYYNVPDGEHNLVSQIRDLALSNERIILVLDNCDNSFCSKIREHIKLSGSNLSVITIGPDISITSNEFQQEDYKIILTPEIFEPVIDQIIAAYYSELTENDQVAIKKFAKGHTLMASLLAEEGRREGFVMGRLTSPVLIDNLVGGQVGSDDRKVLKACSLFEKIGFAEEKKDEADLIATHPIITNLNYGNSQSQLHNFYEVCERQIKRGILERQGRFIVVRPKPLAISLAVEWWDNCPSQSASSVINSMTGSPLGKALCDQMKFLDFHDNAKKAVEDLCGPQGPFGKAEVLNTEEGSRLFRSFVEVNPEATVSTLARLYLNQPIEILKSYKKGRRNLVWALEMLVFRKDTFERAIKVLLHFAVAENEEISNNATSQFLQLFQIFLAGTEANFSERLIIIDYALNHEDPRFKEFGIRAIGRGFVVHHLSRMGGAEKQGSSTELQDYKPDNNEIKIYWTDLNKRILAIVEERNQFSELASDLLISKIRELYSVGAGDIILPTINAITDTKHYNWEKLIKEINETLVFENEKLNRKQKVDLNNLLKKVTPTDFSGSYKLFVKSPVYDRVLAKEESDEDLTNRAKALAKEAYVEDKYIEYIPLFYQGDQAKGIDFGEELGHLLTSQAEDALLFAKVSLEVLTKIEQESRNVAVFFGFLKGLNDPKVKNDVFELLLNHEVLGSYSFNAAAIIHTSLNQIESLFKLIDNGKVSIKSFSVFRYGRALDHLQGGEVAKLATKIISYGIEGSWVALNLLFMYSYREDENWKAVKNVVKDIVSSKGILTQGERITSGERHNWFDSVKRIIEEDKEVSFIERIIEEVFDLINNTLSIYSFEQYISQQFFFLLENHFEIIWPKIAQELLIEGAYPYFHLKNILGSRTSYYGDNEGVLFKFQNDRILEWCKQFSPKAPARIAEMAPIAAKDSNKQWHPLTKKLIDEFGHYEEVLYSLGIRMGNYSWVGTLVPLLNSYKNLLEQLLEHNKQSVRNWAQGMITDINVQIKRENNFDEEGHN